MKHLSIPAILTATTLSIPAFAAPQAPAPHPLANQTAASPATKLTHAEKAAQKKQIEANEKLALAECKKMSGADKKACDQRAKADKQSAQAHLNAN